MDLKIANIDGILREIIPEDEYMSKWKLYSDNPSMMAETAVEVECRDGEKYVLPFRGRNDDRPGIYPDGCVFFIRNPTEENKNLYSPESLNIADFSDVTRIKDFLDTNGQIREMETANLTDIDSVFIPQIGPNDSQEMKAFKEAIASKHIDINKYAQRFGPNFLNDRRILKTESITIKKLVSICEKLDIEAELTLRNSGNDIPNPMPEEISIVLTGKGDDT